MEKTEFDRIAYAELAELLTATSQGTPKFQPLETSIWIAMSALQKSLRRGETGFALGAAATLLRDAPDRLWRRLTVAVFEDVGLGGLGLIAPVLAATSSKATRGKLGGDWTVASALIESMAASRKCRSADDLWMTLIAHPAYEADRLNYTFLPLPDLMQIATGNSDVVSRAIALVFALGTNRCPVQTMRIRQGNPAFAFQYLRDKSFPHCILDLAERGSTRFREPLPALLGLLSRSVPARSAGYEPTEGDDEFPRTQMIGELPCWAADFYSRPGRAAIRQFLARDTPTGNWLRKYTLPAHRVEVLGALVFRAEGGLMKRRLRWPQGDDLRRTMEFEAVGLGVTDATEVLDLLRNDLPVLNEERCNVFEHDNNQLPSANGAVRPFAMNCTNSTVAVVPPDDASHISFLRLSGDVQALISNSISVASQRAYQADIRQYKAWGGTLPSSPEMIAEFIAAIGTTHKVATIARYLASLSKAHRAMGTTNPCQTEIVKATFRGLRRSLGTAQREAKPILPEDLFQILDRLSSRPKDTRDKALLLIGFAGAFRRSELVGLDVADIEHVRPGIVVTLRRSKTDQTGEGRRIGIPFGRSRWCPVRHLMDWLDQTGIQEGPIFQPLNRHGQLAGHRLSGDAVCKIVKERAEAAGFDANLYSGHSLRAGFATSAAIAGASTFKIRAQTGHASDAMLARYIRDGDLFTSNAAGLVL